MHWEAVVANSITLYFVIWGQAMSEGLWEFPGEIIGAFLLLLLLLNGFLLYRIRQIRNSTASVIKAEPPQIDFKAVVDSLPSAVLVMDENFNFLLFNKKYSEYMELDERTISEIGSLDNIIAHQYQQGYFDNFETLEAALEAVHSLHEAGEPFGYERYWPNFDKHVLIGVNPISSGGWVLVQTDITNLKKAEEQANNLAHFDQLTGLPNRNLLNDRLEEAIKRSNRHSSGLAFLYIDLDKFKTINDDLGHRAGDTALKIVADRLKANARGTDTIARVGGDEFVAILEEVNSFKEVKQIAVKISEAVSKPMMIDGNECTLGLSIGISIFPDHAEDAAGLIDCADQAMYAIKGDREGPGYRLFKPGSAKKLDD